EIGIPQFYSVRHQGDLGGHMRLCVATVVAACWVISAVVAPAAAGATPAWSVVPTPSPLGPGRADLRGITCTTATSCVAVGAAETPGGSVWKTLVEHWDGVRWKK